MSRETRVHCDVCKSPILEGGSVLDHRAGPLRQALGESSDWCPTCAQALLDLIRAGRPSIDQTLPLDATPPGAPARRLETTR